MPPRVNLASLKAMEAAVATRAADRKKKRSATNVSHYELRLLKKGPQLRWSPPG